MRVPAVAIGPNQSASAITVFSYGESGQATAGLLAAAGHKVQVIGGGSAPPVNCDITTQNSAHYTTGINVSVGDDVRQAVRETQVVLACVGGTEYGSMCEDLAPHLSSGQTLFLVGAAFGAALEVAHIFSQIRTDLSLNIVEIDQPFTGFTLSAGSVSLSGVKSQLVLSGRSLNETRAGLSLGSGLFNNLVPASNLLERGFANIDKWLNTAALLFSAFGPGAATAGSSVVTGKRKNSPFDRFDNEPAETSNMSKRYAGEPMSAVLSALRAEIKALAKAYGVSRLPEAKPESPLPELPRVIVQREVGRGVIEDFILLSSLARIVYLPLPMLESVIELSSVVSGTDLRKEGRELSDLGLIGMDAREIVEHVSA